MSVDEAGKTLTGPWDACVDQMREWDPKWTDVCIKMCTNPWTSGVLPRKLVELISVALNAACTNLNADGTRRHIKNALAAGATAEETMEVLKLCVAQGIQAFNLAIPILSEELADQRSRGGGGADSGRLSGKAA